MTSTRAGDVNYQDEERRRTLKEAVQFHVDGITFELGVSGSLGFYVVFHVGLVSSQRLGTIVLPWGALDWLKDRVNASSVDYSLEVFEGEDIEVIGVDDVVYIGPLSGDIAAPIDAWRRLFANIQDHFSGEANKVQKELN